MPSMTITLTREEAKQLFDYIDAAGDFNMAEIRDALYVRLAQPEPEPVAWLDSLHRSQPHAVTGFQYLSVSQIERGEQHKYIPVYADPLPDYVDRRQWRYDPMTGEPLHSKLPPEESGCAECGKKASDGYALYCVKCSEPLSEWQGLTDEEINKIAREWQESPNGLGDLSRAIEAKLKEKNNG